VPAPVAEPAKLSSSSSSVGSGGAVYDDDFSTASLFASVRRLPLMAEVKAAPPAVEVEAPPPLAMVAREPSPLLSSETLARAAAPSPPPLPPQDVPTAAAGMSAPKVESQLWSTVEQILKKMEKQRAEVGFSASAEENAAFESLQRTVRMHRSLSAKEDELVEAKTVLLSDLNADLRILRVVEEQVAQAELGGRRTGADARCLSAVRSALVFSGMHVAT
tara:strand:+ start:169 stop:825 length:657 start_codon:yes stop_codon:yes gene_type:complete